MHALPIRLVTALTLLATLPGCGGDDEVCGIEVDSQTSLEADLGGTAVTWVAWRSSPNNDCGEAGGPTSLTLEATQDGTNRGLTLCLPRPDKLSSSAVDVSDDTRFRVIDVFADIDAGDCLASLDRQGSISGTASFPGICDDGQYPEGYSLELDMSVPMTITCGTDTTSKSMTFRAKVAVEATTGI